MSSSSAKNSTTVRSERLVRFTRAALQAAYAVDGKLGATFAERLFTSPRRFARPDRERDVLATARAGELEVTLRSPRWAGTTTRVATWRWGYGPTVLLVHGWEGRGSQLGALVEPLVAAGLSVLTFDAPAHGNSAGSRLYLTDLADTIADVAAATGPLHAIIAHSFGAAGTLLAGTRHGVTAKKTVLISPNAIVADSVSRFERFIALDDSARRDFESSLVASSGIPLEELDLAQLVTPLTGDTLILHDRDDREVPPHHAERLAALVPHAHLVLTDGLGHRRILRAPAVLTRLTTFVAASLMPPVSSLVREVDALLGR